VENGDIEHEDVINEHVGETITRGESAFFGLATRREPGNGKAENLLTLPALIVDFDHRDDRNQVHCSRQALQNGPTPSMIVGSGGGWHGYWLLDPPLDVSTPENVETAKVVIGRLAALFSPYSCRGSLKVTQYMRIPGSVNPRYRPPRFSKVEEQNFRPDWVWPVDELMKWCPREPLKQMGIKRSSGGQAVEPHGEAYDRLRQAYLRRLSVDDMFGLKDIDIGEARHGTCVALAGLLHNGERDADELASILGALWDAYFSRSPRPGEIEGIAEAAVKKTPFAAKTAKEYFIEHSDSLAARIIRRQREKSAAV
jgi:hypothetical protein